MVPLSPFRAVGAEAREATRCAPELPRGRGGRPGRRALGGRRGLPPQPPPRRPPPPCHPDQVTAPPPAVPASAASLSGGPGPGVRAAPPRGVSPAPSWGAPLVPSLRAPGPASSKCDPGTSSLGIPPELELRKMQTLGPALVSGPSRLCSQALPETRTFAKFENRRSGARTPPSPARWERRLSSLRTTILPGFPQLAGCSAQPSASAECRLVRERGGCSYRQPWGSLIKIVFPGR